MVELEDVLFELDKLEVHMKYYRRDGVDKIFTFFQDCISDANVQDDLKSVIKQRLSDKIRSQINTTYYQANNAPEHNKKAKEFITDFIINNKIIEMRDFFINNLSFLRNELYVDLICSKNKLKRKDLSNMRDLVASLDKPAEFKRFLYDNEKNTDIPNGTLKYMDFLHTRGMMTHELFEKFANCSSLVYPAFIRLAKNFITKDYVEYVQNENKYKPLKHLLELMSESKNDNFIKQIYEKNDKNIYTAIYNSEILMKFLIDKNDEDFLVQHFKLEPMNVKNVDLLKKVLNFYQNNYDTERLFNVLKNNKAIDKLESCNSPEIKNFILQNKLSMNEEKKTSRMKI